MTALADIFGEGPAGFLGGIPSAGPASLLFIGLTQSTSAAVQAVSLFPIGFSSTFAFLLFYTVPRKMGPSGRMALALGLWLPISAAIAVWGPQDFEVTVPASVAIALVVLLLRRRIRTERSNHISARPSVRLAMLRGALGGSVVVTVVVLSIVSGPQVGGVFAAAPAIWSSSLYMTARAKGIEFSRSLTLPFMQTSIFTVIPYGFAAELLFPAYGIWLGTLLSFLAITPLAYVAWKLLRPGKG